MDKIVIGNYEFETLVALTDEEHLQGLMFKAWPPPIMSFAFETSEPRKFWMVNTISPLDIIFCNSNKIVGIFEGKPLSRDLVGPEESTDFVIELPFGTAKKYNFSVGDSVNIKYSINTLAKKYTLKFGKYLGLTFPNESL